MRTYQKTHKWISFELDLRRASNQLWIDLGEAISKCEHLSKTPLRPATKTLLHQMYLAKGVAATTAIEGNTLTEEQVLKAVRGELKVPPSQAYLKQDVDNIIEACNRIGKEAAEHGLPALSPELLCAYNAQVLEKLPVGEGVVPGELRKYSVVVGNVYRGAPNEDCSYLLEKLCEWLKGTAFQPPENTPEGQQALYAILKAIVAHLYIAWIHPFGDGNGRTARLVEFHILLAAGVPSPAAHLLSNHYNQTRQEYYRQLDYASRSGGDIVPFVRYAVRGFVDGLHSQLDFVWQQLWDVVWRNYVHEKFKDEVSDQSKRLSLLALELGAIASLVPLNEVSERTARLAKVYGKKSNRTAMRDIQKLEEMGLLVKEGNGVRANREVVFSYLPLRVKSGG